MPSKREREVSRTTRTTTTVVRAERREYRAFCGCCDWLWLVATIEGWLKIFQWISTMLAFVLILAHFNMPIKIYVHFPEYNFMLFVAITAWIFITLHIILKVPHLFEKLPVILLHPILGVVLCLVGAVAFLIASSVMFGYHQDYEPKLKASAISGYVAMFLFIIEAVYIFIRGRKAALSETTTTTTTGTVENVEDINQLVQERKLKEEQQPHGFPA